MLNFNLYFAMKLTNHDEALKQPAISIGLFQVDAMTCGYLVLSVEHRWTDTHSD